MLGSPYPFEHALWHTDGQVIVAMVIPFDANQEMLRRISHQLADIKQQLRLGHQFRAIVICAIEIDKASK